MRRPSLLLACCALAACASRAPDVPGGRGGRFTGVGVFDAGRLWVQQPDPAGSEPAAARLADDEHVIVTLDTRTGEVRECGDHSGRCVAIDPWSATPIRAPVPLAKHMTDLRAEDAASGSAGAR